MAARKLYELVGADSARRLSPFVWRVRFALEHKGLDAAIVPSRFGEKDKASLQQISGQTLVPVFVDGEKVVANSWDICCSIEDDYPDAPSLFGGKAGRSLCHFMVLWTDTTLHTLITKIVMLDVWNFIAKEDKVYFRESREKRYGMTLEEYGKISETNVEAFRKALQPLRLLLGTQEFVGGTKPNFPDYTVMGAFMWAKAVSPTKLFEEGDPVYVWRAKMIDLFDGLGAKAVGFDV
jgi:glutathione S-transferase